MPREELPMEEWPVDDLLLGCSVSKFNPVRREEEHTVDLDENTKLVYEITWGDFYKLDRGMAIAAINDVLGMRDKHGKPVAEYTPGNKDGIVVRHNTSHHAMPHLVHAIFDMDDSYYLQIGGVLKVWKRARHPQEPLIEKRGTALVRM